MEEDRSRYKIEWIFKLFVIFEVFVVCIVVVGVIDGVEVLLFGVWGMEGFCGIICCCEGVDIGMKFGVDGIVGIFGRVVFGIMILGVGIVDGIGCSVFILG